MDEKYNNSDGSPGIFHSNKWGDKQNQNYPKG